MPKQTQSSLTSFFGVAVATAAKKTTTTTTTKKKETTGVENGENGKISNDKNDAASILVKGKVDLKSSSSSPAATASVDSATKRKQQSQRQAAAAAAAAGDDDEEEAAAAVAAKKKINKKRRVIQDSDESDNDDGNDEDGDGDVTMKDTTDSASASSAAKASSVKQDEDDKKMNLTSSKEEAAAPVEAAAAATTASSKQPTSSSSSSSTSKTMGNKETNGKEAKETSKAAASTTVAVMAASKKAAVVASATAVSSAMDKKKSPKEEAAVAGSKKRAPTTTMKSDILKAAMAAAKNSGGKSSSSNSSPVAVAIRSDEVILKEIAELWPENDIADSNDDDAMPYLVLCQAFSKIDAISGRLQIQEIMTTLFRQILLRSSANNNKSNSSTTTTTNENLLAILYLASNSVAPAYECVELGIGDSILIRAIGEATGTSSALIKQKYETEGDLGTVAMVQKTKQKTLGGFFATKKPTIATTAAAGGANHKKKSSSSSGLTVQEVLQVFREIAKTKGNQSQKWKVDKIKRLVVKSSPAHGAMECKYIIRGLQGKLRIGLAQSTLLISLAHAFALTTPPSPLPSLVEPPSDNSNDDDYDDYPEEARLYMDKTAPYEKRLEAAVVIVKKAYSEVPSYDALLTAGLSFPLERMHTACTLTPGIPVVPMLAKPTKSIQEVLKRLNGQAFTCEYKYDGERAQVHLLPDGSTKVFSRNLLDTSEKFPEVPLFVKEAINCSTTNNDNKDGKDGDDKSTGTATTKLVESFVLDAEVVAFNVKTGQLVPFQVLSTRKKTEESGETAKVKVIVQAFDLMYLNGKSLLHKTLRQRRTLLQEHFSPVSGKFQFAVSLDHVENGETDVIEDFLDLAIKGQCEGLMVKTLDDNANYEPSKRSLNWLKLKKDYLQGLGDSVDLVPLGAYHGKGKRTGVYGAYLLACYDADTEEFQSVCKIGTGFSDQDLVTLAESLNQHKIPCKNSQYNVSDQLACDVWFDAVQVWEVKAADLSTSSAHRGAQGKLGDEVTDSTRGIGLRFPRFERLRDDKKPHEATTSDQILEMYYNQDAIVGGNGGDDDDDDGI